MMYQVPVEEDPGLGEIINVEQVPVIPRIANEQQDNVVEGVDGIVEPPLNNLDLIGILYANIDVLQEDEDGDGTIEYECASPVKFGAGELNVPKIHVVVPNLGKCVKLTDGMKGKIKDKEPSSLDLIHSLYDEEDTAEGKGGKQDDKYKKHALGNLVKVYKLADQEVADKQPEMELPTSEREGEKDTEIESKAKVTKGSSNRPSI